MTRSARLRSPRRPPRSRRPPPPRVAGAVIAMAGLLVVLASFVPWMRISNPGGADAGLDGWGNITGVPTMTGQNINEVISSTGGIGSYQPALFPTVLAVFVLAAGTVLMWRRLDPAAWIAATAAAGAGAFAVHRALVPGNVAGIVDASDVHVAAGTWLTAAAALVACGAAAAILLRRRPNVPLAGTSRGIQPR